MSELGVTSLPSSLFVLLNITRQGHSHLAYLSMAAQIMSFSDLLRGSVVSWFTYLLGLQKSADSTSQRHKGCNRK